MLEQTVHRYGNRAIEAAQVIEELIQLARDMREANARGEELGLTDDELAFYDALETNDSAVQVLGDETLRDIARELVETVRNNVKIDWTLAKMSARTCAGWSSAYCGSTATRPTSRRRRRGLCLSRRRRCRRGGRCESRVGLAGSPSSSSYVFKSTGRSLGIIGVTARVSGPPWEAARTWQLAWGRVTIRHEPSGNDGCVVRMPQNGPCRGRNGSLSCGVPS